MAAEMKSTAGFSLSEGELTSTGEEYLRATLENSQDVARRKVCRILRNLSRAETLQSRDFVNKIQVPVRASRTEFAAPDQPDIPTTLDVCMTQKYEKPAS